MVENNQISQNVYKRRNSLGYVRAVGWILIILFVVEKIVIENLIKFAIGDKQLPITIPQEIITIYENSIFLLAALGVLIVIVCRIFIRIHEQNNIPLKDEVINDLHDLLVSQNFIDKDSSNWESEVKLRVKKTGKNIYVARFRIKNPKGTAEYFRKLNLSEGGTFDNCIDCNAIKDGSFVKLELIFGGERYAE